MTIPIPTEKVDKTHMLYLESSNLRPLLFHSAGLLKTDEPYCHMRRNLDTFVIILGSKGTLYVTQRDVAYEVEPNQFLLLLPGYEHYGHRPCEPDLSYYWCHFQVDSSYSLLQPDVTRQRLLMMYQKEDSISNRNLYLIPEYGEIDTSDRITLLFRQVIDLSQRHNYSHSFANYSLSLLAMEITQEFINQSRRRENIDHLHYKIIEIMEWIRVNYYRRFTVRELADVFGYNPNYLSTIFKQHTGLPLLKYINKTRISNAKAKLLDTSETVKSIANQVGFEDDKHFMKLFQQLEGMTPTQYRNIYYRKHLTKSR